MIRYLLLLLGLNQDPDIAYFSFKAAEEYMKAINSNNNSLIVHYDLDGNGISDTHAFFKILSRKPYFLIRDKAYKIALDNDDDQKMDTFYYDSDNNGSLEKKVYYDRYLVPP